MDSRLYITDEGRWDSLRLHDIQPTTDTTIGSKYEHKVIMKVSPYILQCTCTSQLLPYLVKRKVLNDQSSAHILSQPESEAAKNLNKVLMGIAHEPEKEDMIENVYLALFDCYEETGIEWCWGMAAKTLRSTVISELKLPDLNYYDMAVVYQRLQSVALLPQQADQLTHMLHLTGSYTDLKEIVHRSITARVEFFQLVSALLLIPHLGRYVSLLVPYCCCNPPYVYEMIHHLKQHWEKLAAYLGYTELEIDFIARTGGSNVYREIQMFMRTWWMPDCGKEKTQAILSQVFKDKLQISESLMDGGHALLKACMESDWVKAESFIKAGAYLECRSEDGRTPLMHACVRGREVIVNLMIDHGADPQAMDKRGETCLNFQETLRNQTILKRILKEYQKHQVSVDVESLASLCSPLSTACKCGAAASAELLLEYGANPNGCENGKHRPLVEACAQGHMGLVKALLKRKADLDAVGMNGVTPLLQACTNSHWGIAQLLMDEGADVNKCGTDCTSPLFLAVAANSYGIALDLLKKGANVDAGRFQPGAVEGIVELTPLANAAGKGLTSMINLLIEYRAKVNYLCSDTLPAIAFAIIGDQIEAFHALIDTPNLDRTLNGLSSTIITSVKTEKYYFTEKLLEIFGGPKRAMVESQQHHLEQLTEHIVMYMQAVNHPQISDVSLLGPQFEAQTVVQPQVQLSQADQRKINETLTHFSRICVSALGESPDISVSLHNLVGIAKATGNPAVANFFQRVISSSMTPEELRYDFLKGEPSPLRFVVEHKILTIDIFQIEVLKFHPNDAEVFYKDLVWTFRHMNGGTDLPTDIHSMLSRLFNGRFMPKSPPRPLGVHSEESSYHRGVTEPVHQQVPAKVLETSTTAHIAYAKAEKNLNENLMDSRRSLTESGETEKVNPMPGDKSKVAMLTVEHVRYNIPNQEPINDDHHEMIHTTDKAKVVTRTPFCFKGINRNLGGLESYYLHQSCVFIDEEEEKDLHLPTCIVNPTGVMLGQGAYGDVLEVEYKGKLYAAKKYRITDSDEAKLGAFSREQDILATIRHPNIVPYYGVCRLPPGKTTVIVMERMDINLDRYLTDNEDITLIKKFYILSDVAKGLDHLHSQRPAIIHRDLTAGNVLLNSTGVAKIGDFGNSKMIDLRATPEILTRAPGTLDYMPPEAMDGNEYTITLDIFSYGHLAIHIIIQRRPHPILSPTYMSWGKLIPRTEVERRQAYLDEVELKLGGKQHPFFSVITNCLQYEPTYRPSCAKILKCSVFDDLRNNATN